MTTKVFTQQNAAITKIFDLAFEDQKDIFMTHVQEFLGCEQ